MTSLIEILKKENQHGLVTAILNDGILVPVGVINTLKIAAKQNGNIDIGLLVRADHDQFILNSVKKYLESKESEVVNKLINKAKVRIIGGLKEEYVGLVSCFYGNHEIIMSFGHLTYVIGIGGLGWERIDETSDYTGKDYHLNREEILAILEQ